MITAVLSGGGSHGPYQVGALDYFTRVLGRRYDRLYGVSVGGLNAGFLSMYPLEQQDVGVGELKEFWRPLKTGDIYKHCPVPFGDYISAATGISIYDSMPLNRLVLKTYDYARSASSGVMCKVGAVCWDTGDYKILSQHEDRRFAYWIMASASYPVFFRPVKIDGQLWTDGGAMNVTPIRQAIVDGAKEIDVIVCQPVFKMPEWDPKGEKAVPGYLFRLLELMNKEVARTDLEVCGYNNQIAELRQEYEDVKIRVLMPTHALVGSSLEFSPINTALNFRRGYTDARSARQNGMW
jgi:NTE family protein